MGPSPCWPLCNLAFNSKLCLCFLLNFSNVQIRKTMVTFNLTKKKNIKVRAAIHRPCLLFLFQTFVLTIGALYKLVFQVNIYWQVLLLRIHLIQLAFYWKCQTGLMWSIRGDETGWAGCSFNYRNISFLINCDSHFRSRDIMLGVLLATENPSKKSSLLRKLSNLIIFQSCLTK